MIWTSVFGLWSLVFVLNSVDFGLSNYRLRGLAPVSSGCQSTTGWIDGFPRHTHTLARIPVFSTFGRLSIFDQSLLKNG